jgi:hypothetical protein
LLAQIAAGQMLDAHDSSGYWCRAQVIAARKLAAVAEQGEGKEPVAAKLEVLIHYVGW